MFKKKNKEIVVGSNNDGKIKEIKDLLPKYYIITSPKDYGLKSPKENGDTFLENSLIKAKYFSKKSKSICLADDSGLEIDILGKLPGIYSARWAGKKSDFRIAIRKVFKELKKNKVDWKKKIKCRFICALTIYWTSKKYYQSQGTVEGFLSDKPKGKKGFGYDPIFLPAKHKKTFGQLSLKNKQRLSHRYKAFSKIKKYFKFS